MIARALAWLLLKTAGKEEREMLVRLFAGEIITVSYTHLDVYKRQPISSGSGTAVVYDLSGLSFSPQIKVEGDTDEDALIRKLRDLERCV